MKVSDRLYAYVKPIWDKYLEHPFVRGIADGTLPIDKFQFYMIQDHKYLMQYAKVFALGVLKSQDEEDMRAFAHMISSTLNTENAVHQSYLKRLGISREQIAATPASIVTESYTNYMISVSTKEGLGELMVAVLACFWSYKLIGDFMEQQPGANAHEFYGTWVRQYMSEGFRAGNANMIEMVDRTCAHYTEEQLQNLERIIHVCSQYEYMFWDMAWNKKMVEI